MDAAADVVSLDQVEREREERRRARTGSAPLPLFAAIGEPTPYPIDALGYVLGRAAVAIANKVQVPPAIAGQSVLAVGSLAAQALADVQMPYGQTRPLSVICQTIIESGGRKSSADNEAAWPVRKREAALRERYEVDHAEWKIQSAAYNAQRRKVENDAKLSRDEREFELRALGTEPLPPLHPILTAPDPTIEGLQRAWVSAPASLGIFSAEGGQFVGGYGMSPDHKIKTAAALSELWDGRGMRRLRASDGLTILDGRRLAGHLMLQPEVAANFLNDPILKDQGLLSRILIAAPASISGTRLYREPVEADNAAIRAYGARILSLLETPWPLVEGKRCEIAPPVLVMTPEAEDLWRGYFNHVERQSGIGGDLDGIRDFAAKSAEQAARIAGILTVVDDPKATTIGIDAMANGIALAQWHLQEAARLTAGARIDPTLIRANRLLTWMRAQGEPVTLRRILQFGPNAMRIKSVAEEALKVLIDHGHLVAEGAKATTYRIVQPEAAE